MRDLTGIVKAYDVRGTVPDELSPEVAHALGAAFAEVVAKPDGASQVVVGRDMRDSGPDLVAAFSAGVVGQGVDVVDIGLCSTDGMYYASGSLDLPGAMFTASHNPARYNGIKMCHTGARPVGESTGLPEVRDLAAWLLDTGPSRLATGGGAVRTREVLADYAAHLRSLVPAVASGRRLRVVVDAGNGMAGLTAPAVLGDAAGLPALPLDVVPLYFELDGTFPHHEANPLDPKNVVDLQHAVVEQGADLGLAFDGDADRCFVVDETGRAVPASAITALVAAREIARAREAGEQDVTVVHNVISSRAVPETIRAAGATPVRTRVGHSFIKGEMAAHDAVFGGEHSAHYYFRDFWFADTGMLAALHVLAALAHSDGTLSQLVAEFDPYPQSGEINTTVADVPAVLARVRAWADVRGHVVDDLDGLTVTADGDPWFWFSVRPSNTEPLLRLNVEAQDTATTARVRDEITALVAGDVAPVTRPHDNAESSATTSDEGTTHG